MKLATFRTREAPASQFGAVLSNDRLLSLRAAALTLLPEYSLPERYEASRVLRHALAFLEHGQEAFALAYRVIERAEQELARGREPRGEAGMQLCWPADRVELLPPVPKPGKILAAGRNFADHASEMGLQRTDAIPGGFVKVASTLIGHNGAVIYPAFTSQLDYEAEIAAVIGRPAKNLTTEEALKYVAGYTIFNDLSARDWQRDESTRGNHLLGKNFDTSGPLGPYLVTADEVPDPGHLDMALRVNGEPRQRGNTDQMLSDFATLIAHWSRMTLYPGDLITSGSPAGVAAGHSDDTWWLRPGDVIEITVGRLGTLRNTVRRP